MMLPIKRRYVSCLSLGIVVLFFFVLSIYAYWISSWNLFQYHFDSRSQLCSPLDEHPLSIMTKSPSWYPSPRLVWAYEAIVRWGTSAILERIVGCHCTMCSYYHVRGSPLAAREQLDLPEHVFQLSGNCMFGREGRATSRSRTCPSRYS